MSFKDLREFIAFLDDKGDLRHIKTPVSCELEMTEIADRVVKSGGPALLFENVIDSEIPVLMNIFGTHQRVAWALGVDNAEELAERARKAIDLLKGPPSGVLNKMRTLGDLVGMARTQPKIVRKAPCQDVVLTGDDVDLNMLPALKCWPMDAGRFITLPLVISRDPETGVRNVGIYRMQIYDSRTTGMHWQTHKVGAHHYRASEEAGRDKLEVAVALGGDPTTIWTGVLPIPPSMDEIGVSGFIRGEAVEMVRCRTVDLEVPARAEFILEGYLTPGELRAEGPFGDHTGYYSPAEDYPVFHVTAMTHRRDPIYLTTMVGRPPNEDYFMGVAAGKLLLPALQMSLPEVVDMSMPAEGGFHNLLIVSIKKEYPGHARKVMHALWGLGLLMLTKTIIVVDHFVNVQDPSEVTWRVTNNIDPIRDVVFVDGPIDDLDHAAPVPKFGSKMGIDATAKGPMDGRTREWPADIVMSKEIKDLVDSKWDDYRI